MRKFLVNEKQKFGEVHSAKVFNPINGPKGMERKSLGAEMQRSNDGFSHAPSFADKAPMAREIACRGNDNPFMWTGHPKRG